MTTLLMFIGGAAIIIIVGAILAEAYDRLAKKRGWPR